MRPLLWRSRIKCCVGSYEPSRLMAAMRVQSQQIGVNESGLDDEGSNVESVTLCQIIRTRMVPDVRWRCLLVIQYHSMSLFQSADSVPSQVISECR